MALIEDIVSNKPDPDAFRQPSFRGWGYMKALARLAYKYARRYWKQLLIGLAIVTVVAVIGVIIDNQNNSDFPKNIKKQADFSIFYPETADGALEVERPTVSYSSTNHGLSYQVYINSLEVIVSEQASPDIFTENGVYAFKLSQAHEYNSFDSNAGEVALTKPAEFGGQTVAWDNTRGTLILAHAYQPLTLDQWKLLFNSLTVVN